MRWRNCHDDNDDGEDDDADDDDNDYDYNDNTMMMTMTMAITSTGRLSWDARGKWSAQPAVDLDVNLTHHHWQCHHC